MSLRLQPVMTSKWLPMTICSDKILLTYQKEAAFGFSMLALQPLFSNYASDPLEIELVSWLELVGNPRAFPSVFTYCKQSNTGSGEGLRTRISTFTKLSTTHIMTHTSSTTAHTYIIYYRNGTAAPGDTNSGSTS